MRIRTREAHAPYMKVVLWFYTLYLQKNMKFYSSVLHYTLGDPAKQYQGNELMNNSSTIWAIGSMVFT
jgi:hypothetical protein